MARPTGSYKQPAGCLQVEGITTVSHTFKDGVCLGTQEGLTWHTGRYRFQYAEDDKTTRWYTARQAPKWMQVMIREVRD